MAALRRPAFGLILIRQRYPSKEDGGFSRFAGTKFDLNSWKATPKQA